jgi:hypothetical protein
MEHGGTGDDARGDKLGIWQAVDIIHQSSYAKTYRHQGHEWLNEVPGHRRQPGAP